MVEVKMISGGLFLHPGIFEVFEAFLCQSKVSCKNDPHPVTGLTDVFLDVRCSRWCHSDSRRACEKLEKRGEMYY